MKALSIILALALSTTMLSAQKTDTKEVDASQAAAPVWLTNYEEAIALAAEQDRIILTNFTGSDWCIWCIRIKNDIFDKELFQSYAAENIVLLELDFPSKKEQTPELKKQNRKLQSKYGIDGFPTLIVIDAKGKELARNVGYLRGGPEGMIGFLEAAGKGSENH